MILLSSIQTIILIFNHDIFNKHLNDSCCLGSRQTKYQNIKFNNKYAVLSSDESTKQYFILKIMVAEWKG